MRIHPVERKVQIPVVNEKVPRQWCWISHYLHTQGNSQAILELKPIGVKEHKRICAKSEIKANDQSWNDHNQMTQDANIQ